MSLRCSDGEHFVDHFRFSEDPHRDPRAGHASPSYLPVISQLSLVFSMIAKALSLHASPDPAASPRIRRKPGCRAVGLSGDDSSSAPASHLNSGDVEVEVEVEVEARSQPAPTRGGSPGMARASRAGCGEKCQTRRIKRV
jgi:hypothetical protein